MIGRGESIEDACFNAKRQATETAMNAEYMVSAISKAQDEAIEANGGAADRRAEQLAALRAVIADVEAREDWEDTESMREAVAACRELLTDLE